MNFTDIRRAKWFETAYKIGIAIKGIDGLAELAAGIALLLTPSIVHMVLSTITGEALEHSGRTAHFIAENVARLDGDLQRTGLAFLIVFLIGHGVVKLVLVYCLLRRIVWAYPYALGVLVLFLLYQIYALAGDVRSVGMWLFTILDILIIWLVYGEWSDLREKAKK